MSKSILILLTVALCVIFAATAMSSTVSIKLSGAGKVNDSTIKAGQKVSLDIYFDNEVPRMGLSLGFRIFSPDKSITTILHPADSGNGIEDSKGGVRGDIKGYNGFEDKAIFNLLNKAVITNWDGKLPDTMGIMTMVFAELTLGVNVKELLPDPLGAVVVRPEIRYDNASGFRPFNNGRNNNSFTIGTDLLLSF